MVKRPASPKQPGSEQISFLNEKAKEKIASTFFFDEFKNNSKKPESTFIDEFNEEEKEEETDSDYEDDKSIAGSTSSNISRKRKLPPVLPITTPKKLIVSSVSTQRKSSFISRVILNSNFEPLDDEVLKTSEITGIFKNYTTRIGTNNMGLSNLLMFKTPHEMTLHFQLPEYGIVLVKAMPLKGIESEGLDIRECYLAIKYYPLMPQRDNLSVLFTDEEADKWVITAKYLPMKREFYPLFLKGSLDHNEPCHYNKIEHEVINEGRTLKIMLTHETVVEEKF
ncbi:hypothetical protein ACTFIY_000255 [Dictyostelium cf. discoideum]